MKEKGFENVFALKGGWQDWFRSEYPVEEK
jgi:3-mercaptopyruvate sulfurtransferase SseA